MQKDLKTQSLVITLLVVASMVIGYFVTFAFWDNYSKSKAELARAEFDRSSLLDAQAQLEAFLRKFETLYDKAEIAGKALPTKPETAVLLASLEELAKLSGMALSTVNIIENIDATNTATPIYSIMITDLQLNASGSYFSFNDFLNRLEHHLRLTDIKSISFELDDANNIQAQIQLRTYYQK